MSVKFARDLGWEDQVMLETDFRLCEFLCPECGHLFTARVLSERVGKEYIEDETLCPECSAPCIEEYGLADRENVVEDLRDDWHFRMESRYETCVRRRGQYPKYKDEPGFIDDRPVLKRMVSGKSARNLLARRNIRGLDNVKYAFLYLWKSGLNLNLISEHPDKAFYHASAAYALKSAVASGSDWLTWRVVTLVYKLGRKQLMEVTLPVTVLSMVDQAYLRQHIATQVGLHNMLAACGVGSLRSLRVLLAVMEVPEHVSGVTSRSTVLSWCPADHPHLEAFDTGQVGIKLVLWPNDGLFLESDISEIEATVGVKPLKSRVIDRR